MSGPRTRTFKRRTRGPKRGMKTLAELVPAVYPSSEPDAIRLVRISAWWERTLPARVVRNVRPVKLSRGTLVVHATTSAWAQELTLAHPDLLEQIRIGTREQTALQRMRVRVGAMPPRIVPEVHVPPKFIPIPPEKLPPPLTRVLETIEDPRLREAVALAAGTSLALPIKA